MVTEAQKRASAKYRRKMHQVCVTFGGKSQAEWEWLDSKPNKAEYIKELIREDMRKG